MTLEEVDEIANFCEAMANLSNKPLHCIKRSSNVHINCNSYALIITSYSKWEEDFQEFLAFLNEQEKLNELTKQICK